MQPEIRSFALLLRSPVNHAMWCDSAKNANCSEKCNVFGNGKCELSANQEGKNWGANFLARKSAKLFANTNREKDGSDVTIVALKLAMSFALLLAKNVHLSIDEEFCAIFCQKICTSVSPLLNGAEFTLSVAKTLHFSKQFAFFALSNGVIDRGSKQQSKRWNFRLHRSFSSKYRKNESN